MARTILVVDDEPTLREMLVETLEADGFRVVEAADGREALTRFRADRPDLVGRQETGLDPAPDWSSAPTIT